MLRTVACASWMHALACGSLLSALGACSARSEAVPGHVEVLVSGVCDGARDGQLRLEGVTSAVVTGGELCQGSIVRELPPGLYSLSWQDSAHERAAAASAWQGPTLLSVVAGRTTRLRVTLDSLLSPALSAASEGDDAVRAEETCGHAAERAGPS